MSPTPPDFNPMRLQSQVWPGLPRPAHGLVMLAAAGILLAACAVLAVVLVERINLVGTLVLCAWLGLMAALGWSALRAGVGPALWLAAGLFSLCLRGWSVDLASGVALGADPMNYTNLALSLLDGQGLKVDDIHYGRGLRAYFPPLYPTVLAGAWGVFGVSVWTTLALNTAFDLAAAWLLADIARRIGQVGTGPWLAIAYLCWPAFALAAGVPQKESLTLLLAIAMLHRLVAWLGDGPAPAWPWRHGLVLGLCWGLLALTQPSLVLMPLAIAGLLLFFVGWRPVLRLGLCAALPLLLVLLPWWLRNWWLFDRFVPLTTASGMMMNTALGALARPFPDGLFQLPEPQRAAIMGELAREVMRHDFGGFLSQSLRAMAHGFAFEEAALNRFRHTTPPISAQQHAALEPVLQGAYVALLGAAVWSAWRRPARTFIDPVLLATAAVIVSIAAINPWFEFGERHRLVLTPLWLLVAAWCFQRR